MRDFFFSILVGAAWFLASSAPLLSQSIMHLTGPGGYGAASPTYLIRQTFNGTGYDNSETWGETNNPNEDYATSPAPLEGSHSWHGSSSTESVASPVFSAPATAYAYLRINALAVPGANIEIFKFLNSVELASLQFRSSGLMRIEHGTVTANFFTPTANGTVEYHIWLDYAPGGGTNGVMNAYHATTSTKPGSPTATIITGTSTTQANQIGLFGGAVTDVVLVDDVNIGSNPTF